MKPTRVERLCAAMTPRQRRLVVVLYAFATADPDTKFELGLESGRQVLSARGADCGRYLVRTDPKLAALYREVLDGEGEVTVPAAATGGVH